MKRLSFLCTVLLLFLLTACGPAINHSSTYSSSKVNPSFQVQMSPVPTSPTYTCGAWSSPNNPTPYSTITIYAKLTRDVTGIAGIQASAIAHLQYGDVSLDQHPVSDKGGYVSFFFALGGRQPYLQPATVDISFNLSNQVIHCAAFFTPD
jgi:hypothetical protein